MKTKHVSVHRAKDEHAYPHGNRIYYGQRFSAAIFESVRFVDFPETGTDWDWIAEHLTPRLAPGATITVPGSRNE